MKKVYDRNVSVISAGFVGAGIGLVFAVISLFILAYLAIREFVSLENASIIVPGIQFASALLCALSASKLTKNQAFTAILWGIGMLIITLLCSALLFFDGISGSVIYGILAILAGGVIALLLIRGKKTTKRKRSRSFAR